MDISALSLGISLFAAVSSLAVGIWTGIINYRISRRTTFINTITAERVKWIGKVREDISEFVGLMQYFCYSIVHDKLETTDQSQEIIRKIDSLRYLIKLQLNPDDDKALITLIDDIPNLTHHPDVFNTVQTAINRLVICSQSLLKNEWEKVKDEAKRGDLRQSRRLKQSIFLSLAILAYASSAEAQSYLCIADKETGFSFNKRKKDWEITRFDVSDDKYILTKKWSDLFQGMRWTWTKVGENFGEPCSEKGDFTERDFFRCEFVSGILYMNRKNMRFQLTYPYGYPQGGRDTNPFGEEEGADTPYIEIGRCAEVK